MMRSRIALIAAGVGSIALLTLGVGRLGLRQVQWTDNERTLLHSLSIASLEPLVTHRFKLDEIEAAYDLFAHQREGVLKVAITP